MTDVAIQTRACTASKDGEACGKPAPHRIEHSYVTRGGKRIKVRQYLCDACRERWDDYQWSDMDIDHVREEPA